ncbi:unnamed protein product [Diatraea saccharalis]|uniref:Uncharacterized protein n=1 Tax=Diatraea saccharalis TaxID=40085 RepID=A0A9N9N2N1_9NEOP|nr:unnamed protein product [Diatraea saccharalis]
MSFMYEVGSSFIFERTRLKSRRKQISGAPASQFAEYADGTSIEDREAEASTLRELQEAIFDLEHRHRIYRRSLARETKYGSKQAPIGDDNYLHLAGAAGNVDGDPFHWRAWRGDTSPTVDLDGQSLPLQSSFDIGSSTESVKLARHADERSSGKSNKSTTSGYLTMSCLKHEPSEDSDASADKPARPPKPARLSPSRVPFVASAPLCEYVEVEPRPPERRPKPDASPPDRPDLSYRCKEYELMTNFLSHARPPGEEDAPPAVPPRGHTAAKARLHPKPLELDPTRTRARSPSPEDSATFFPSARSPAGSTTSLPGDGIRNLEEIDRPGSKIDSVSNDDSLLDELQRDTYCVLKVCEDDPPDDEANETTPDRDHADDKEYATFSRISMKRKSNPIKSQTNAAKPLKTSNSTSNVHDAGSSSRPLAERLTPFFLKKKKPPEEAQQTTSKGSRKEDNLIGRLTPRFGQSRLYGRGQSLELAASEPRQKRIERSATAVSMPTRPINSSIVANLKFLSLHRYGAQEEVQCRAFVRTGEHAPPAPAPAPADTLEPTWRRASLLATAPNDIRL